jgi:hypothetical protein
MARRRSPQRQCLRSRSLFQRQKPLSEVVSEVIRGHQRSSVVIRGSLRGSLRCHQRSSVVIRGSLRGHQRSSEVVSGAQAHASTWTPRTSTRGSRLDASASAVGPRVVASEGIRGHQRASAHRCGASCGASCGALCGTYVSFTPLWPEAISGNQWQSVAISGNQWQSTYVSFTPLWPEGHRSARVVTSAHELLEGEAYLWGRGAPW